jgi:hypothetical protein
VSNEAIPARLSIKASSNYNAVCPEDECCKEYQDNSAYTYTTTPFGMFIVMSVVRYSGVESSQVTNNTMPFSRKADAESLPTSVCSSYLHVKDVQVDTYLVIPKKGVSIKIAYLNNSGIAESVNLDDDIELVENDRCVIRKIGDILDSRLSLDTSSLGSDYVYYVYGHYDGQVKVSNKVPFSPKCFYFMKVSSFSFGSSGISSGSTPKSLYAFKYEYLGSNFYKIAATGTYSNLFVRKPSSMSYSGSAVSVFYSKDVPDKTDLGAMLVNSLVNFSENSVKLGDVLSQDSSKPLIDINLNVKSLISILPSYTSGEPLVYGKDFSTSSVNVLMLSFLSDVEGNRSFSELFLAKDFGYFHCDRWNVLAKSGSVSIFGSIASQESSKKFFTGLVELLSSINLGGNGKEKVWRDTPEYRNVIDFLKKNKDLETFPGDVYNVLVPISGNPMIRYAIPSDIIFSYSGSPFLRFYINIPPDVNKIISSTSGSKGKKS